MINLNTSYGPEKAALEAFAATKWAQHLISRRSPCPQHTTTIIEPAHCGSKGQSRSAQKLSGLSGGSSSRQPQPRSAKPNPTAPTRRTSPHVAPQATRSGSGRATAETQRCCRRRYYAATITAAAGGGAATGLTRWLLAAHSPRPASTRGASSDVTIQGAHSAQLVLGVATDGCALGSSPVQCTAMTVHRSASAQPWLCTGPLQCTSALL